VIEELSALRRKDQRGVRFVPPESWHLTLRFLGDADVDVVATALDRAVLPEATVTLGPAVDVLSERALVVPASGLDALAAVVAEHTAHLGEPPRRRFTGHLTIARLKPHAEMPTTLGAMIHAEFDVHEVALVQSRLDPDGARYTTISSWETTVR
jgi:2'-5' RNA ligase